MTQNMRVLNRVFEMVLALVVGAAGMVVLRVTAALSNPPTALLIVGWLLVIIAVVMVAQAFARGIRGAGLSRKR